jgi:tetratricopeptide (TPR) repeat protein
MSKVTAQDWFDSAMMMVANGDMVQAAILFQNAIMVRPDYHEAWANRGNCLHALSSHFDATLNYNMAIHHNANMAEYWNNRGATWADLRCYEKALDDYRHAIALNPKMSQAHSNMGNILKMMGKIEEARHAYVNAIEADPNYIDAQLNKSIMDLERGDLAEGFKGFEVRWKSGQIPPRGLPCPDWNGEDLNGKRIVLYSEQGLGDTLQFCRYATVIKERYPYSRITIECRLPLAKLMKTVSGVDDVVVYGDRMMEQDYACAMMSAPRVCGTTMETIPAPMKYISADPHHVEKWRTEFNKEHMAPFKDWLKVGICWSGQSRPLQPIADSVDKRRSTALSQWAPVAEAANVLFVSLQAGAPAEQVRRPPQGMTIVDYSEHFDDFADTAALIENLDLVISVDTAVVHCAAALGKPTWMLSRYDGCWRWHGARKDSPWYPTLTQFRQPSPGDWDGVMKAVAADLKRSMMTTQAWASQQMPVAAE